MPHHKYYNFLRFPEFLFWKLTHVYLRASREDKFIKRKCFGIYYHSMPDHYIST